MKLKSLTLEKFRQFPHSTIRFTEFNVLVGPNNSGKTTILHALRAFFALMSGHVTLEGTPPKPAYHRRFLSNVQELVPTPDHRELWFQKRAGSPCRITVVFEDDTEFSVVLRQQFGQVHASAESLPALPTLTAFNKYLNLSVAFIPGLVGVLVNEPYATFARRNSMASQGRYAEIFRSSLHQLNERDTELVKKVNGTLSELFGVTVSRISFDPNSQEYVTVEYDDHGTSLDISSSGSGLQQAIQILTYLYLSKPNILLIDEPDAHLHSQLQGRLGALFRQVAKDLKAQVFLSTHSIDLIDTAAPHEVIVVDARKSDIQPLAASTQLVDALVAAGIVENSSLSRIIASRRMVIVEDESLSLFKVIDRITGAGMFSLSSGAFVKSARGESNFPHFKELANIIGAFTGKPIEIVFIHDRDGLPDFLAKDYIDSMKTKQMEVRLLERHELESYLVSPELFSEATEGNAKPDEIKKIIVAAGNTLKQEARQMCRKTAKAVNRHLPDGRRRKDDDLEREVDGWFDDLDNTNWKVVATVWPGKELLKEIREQLHQNRGIDVRPGKLESTLKAAHLPEELKGIWTALAGRTDGKTVPSATLPAKPRPQRPRAKRSRKGKD